MKLTIDVSRDGLEWDEYVELEGDDVTAMALQMADELHAQGVWVKVWDEQDALLWDGGQTIPAWKQVSPFEMDWLRAGGRLSPSVLPEEYWDEVRQ